MALRFLSITRRSQCLFPKCFHPVCDSVRYNNTNNDKKSIYRSEESKRLRFFVLNKYIEYLKNYDQVLGAKFPKAMSMYNVFMKGLKDFYNDIKKFFKIVMRVNAAAKGVCVLNRSEMEMYHQMPKDMVKIAPILIFSTLPLSNYVVLPLAFMFPKHLLTSHFWTEQQKIDFSNYFFEKRLKEHKRIYYYIKSEGELVGDCYLKESVSYALHRMYSYNELTPEDVLDIKPLFESRPFHFDYLHHRHIVHLLKLHALHTGMFRRIRLRDHARLLKAMDAAIIMEGGIHNMPIEALRRACLIRGLNPNFLPVDHLITWLQKWIQISEHVDNRSLSLLLHATMFLGYAAPSNRELIIKYEIKK